jgi:hypothetical protein
METGLTMARQTKKGVRPAPAVDLVRSAPENNLDAPKAAFSPTNFCVGVIVLAALCAAVAAIFRFLRK